MNILSRAVDIRIVIAVFIILFILPQTLLAEEDVSTDFESCILQEHGDFEQSSEAAFQIGTCFYQIVHTRCEHTGDKHLIPQSSVSSHIILQYADSWFVLAAQDGHQAAIQKLVKTRSKLDDVISK